MEADFLREYRVDLVNELTTMSWRRFSVLIRCLSPGSATIAKLSSGKYIGSSHRGPRADNVVTGKKAAEAAFNAIFRKD